MREKFRRIYPSFLFRSYGRALCRDAAMSEKVASTSRLIAMVAVRVMSQFRAVFELTVASSSKVYLPFSTYAVCYNGGILLTLGLTFYDP